MAAPDLDAWVPCPSVRVSHIVGCRAEPGRAWMAARAVRLADARVLGRLIRWRIPGVPAGVSFDDLFRGPPFVVLEDAPLSLLSGIVGRIWTMRRDYPTLERPAEFRDWNRAGTVRVVFANWVEPAGPNGCTLGSETRVEAFGLQGRIGLGTVRPLIRGFQQLIATEALAAAVRAAEA